jgi:uncharacterized protein YsxB (DUF464 family)
MFQKTLKCKAEALECELKKEMSELYLKVKDNNLSDEQKARVKLKLEEMEAHAQEHKSKSTRFFGAKK